MAVTNSLGVVDVAPGINPAAGSPATSKGSTPVLTTGGAPDKRVYQEIEQTARTYGPSVYDVLSKYDRLSTETDFAASQYVPISQQGMYSKDAKLFAIGILPPSSNVTGRKLDRSASIASVTGAPDELGKNSSTSSGPTGPAKYGVPNVPEDFWPKYVAMCQRLGVDPKALGALIWLETGFNSGVTAKVGSLECKGLNALIESNAKALGMTADEWANYQNATAEEQLYWIEKCYQKSPIKGLTAGDVYVKHLGGYQGSNPNGAAWCSLDYQKAYIADHPGFVFPGPNPNADGTSPHQYASYRELAKSKFDADGNGFITSAEIAAKATGVPSAIGAKIDAASSALAAGADGSLKDVGGPSGGATTANWAGSGAADAKTAAKGIDKTANRDLNLTDLGLAFQAAQQAVIDATKKAIDQMAKTPPLKLMVNPTSFKTSAEKIISDGNYGRNGPIIEVWGEQQDKIEGSGKLAGFYAVDATTGVGPGLTRTARNASESYQNFLSLYLLYKSNGAIWFPPSPGSGPASSSSLSVLGSIYIYYDNIMYIGSFDSFNITETDSAPFTLEYNFSFTVRAWFLLDTVQDPRLTYGSAATRPTTSIPTSSGASSTPPTSVSDAGLDTVPSGKGTVNAVGGSGNVAPLGAGK